MVRVDRPRLEATLDAFAKKVDRPAQDGGVTFDGGTANPHFPSDGVALDTEQAAADIVAAYLDGGDEILPMPVDEVPAEITDGEVTAAMKDFADPAVSAPVTIRLAGRKALLRPARYSAALSLQNQDGSLVPVLADKALMKAMKPVIRKITRKPKPATVRLVDGHPEVVEAKKGVTFDQKTFVDQFLTLMVQKGKHRTFRAEPVRKKAGFTTSDAEKLGIEEVVSSFTTGFPHADYRNVNLGRAAELIDGTVLEPGDTFSLNDTVGERTRANGFVMGYIIRDGVYATELGGGVSQVATTLFNAAFFAGLEDVAHTPHSFYIDRYPVGREATVAWGSIDLRFTNDTPYGILIQAGVDPSSPSHQGAMHVAMWSTKYWHIEAGVSDRYDFTDPGTRHVEDPGCVPHQGYRGFDVDVTRTFYRADGGADGSGGDPARTETMHTTYRPSDTVVCGQDRGH